MLDNDASKMLEQAARTMIPIIDQCETHDSLMNDSFNTLLTVPRTKFHQYFNIEMMR